MRRLALFLAVLTLAASLHGKDQKSLEQLRAEAEKAGGGHQALL